MGGGLIDVSKASDCLPHDILFLKLVNHGFPFQIIILIRQTKNSVFKLTTHTFIFKNNMKSTLGFHIMPCLAEL